MRRELEIAPEPSPEERAAIAAALEAVLGDDDAAPSTGSWWAAGARVSLADDGNADCAEGVTQPPDLAQATTRRPRRRFGATRA